MSAAPAIPLDSLGEPAIPFAGYSRERIDDALVNPDLYASGEIYDVFAKLRAKDLPQLMRPRGYRPFYAIVKHADILEIEKNNQVFVNGLRTYLSPIQGEAWTMATFGDTHVFRTLVDLDDPVHMKLRMLTQAYFMPPSLKKLEARIADLAEREEIASIRPDLDGQQIMAVLGISPGPVVGRAYKHLLELRMERGPVDEETAKADLLAWWAAQE